MRELTPPFALATSSRYIRLGRSEDRQYQLGDTAGDFAQVPQKFTSSLLTMRYCIAALWLSALATLAAAADAPHDPPPAQADDIELTEEEKRAWSSLHGGGGWGKRGWQDMSSAWGKRAWQDLQAGWGKRGWQDLNSAWGKRGWQDLNSAWGKRGWQDLNTAWGKRAWRDMSQAPWGKRGWQDMSSAWGKRGWQDMSSAWGKRAWQDLQAGWGKRGWQDMSSAWGKRAPEKWANFHGSWGKRTAPETDYEDYEMAIDHLLPLQQDAADQPMETPEKKAWSALHGAWGKRPVKPAQYNSGAYYWKREPGWTNLRGMWGKRSSQRDLDDEHDGAAVEEA
ncbi:uncharacterized protein Mip isoform X1 [Epargyreus clarus]|uniref:uncharacterized protein Mip isoform X1 n=1 Tax=Epargyreus clarus TaxID=520877 RepID=UPI003C2B1C55